MVCRYVCTPKSEGFECEGEKKTLVGVGWQDCKKPKVWAERERERALQRLVAGCSSIFHAFHITTITNTVQRGCFAETTSYRYFGVLEPVNAMSSPNPSVSLRPCERQPN